MVFTWMSFWGLVFCVKAAHHAVERLRHTPVRDRRVPLPQPRLLGLEHRQGSLRRALPRRVRLRCLARAHPARWSRARVRAARRGARRRRLRAAALRRHLGRSHHDRPRRPRRARRDAPLRPWHRRTTPQPGRHDPAAGGGRHWLRHRRPDHAQLPRPRRRRSEGRGCRGRGRHRPALQHLRQGREDHHPGRLVVRPDLHRRPAGLAARRVPHPHPATDLRSPRARGGTPRDSR